MFHPYKNQRNGCTINQLTDLSISETLLFDGFVSVLTPFVAALISSQNLIPIPPHDVH